MSVHLVDINDHVPLDRQTAHSIRAFLEVRDILDQWAINEPKDYNKIIRSMIYGCENKRVPIEKFVKRDDRPDRPIYEFRADHRHARILFFYALGAEEVIVCTNCYWKTDDKKKKQTREFDKAFKLMNEYFALEERKNGKGN